MIRSDCKSHCGTRARIGAVLLAAALSGGCASMASGPNASPADPIEPVNRVIYAFNDGLDRVVVKPVAQGYVAVVPELFRNMINNVFGNVADVWTSVNQLLQGKPREALGDLSRFVINSTFGLVGLADVASELGLTKHREDFGQTLGVWGLPSGPYLVLPFLGPSSVRDGTGLIADITSDPLRTINNDGQRNSLYLLRLIDTRAGLLDAEKLMQGAALDRYSFLRDGYLQRRQSQVYDGNPPEPKPAPPKADPK